MSKTFKELSHLQFRGELDINESFYSEQEVQELKEQLKIAKDFLGIVFQVVDDDSECGVKTIEWKLEDIEKLQNEVLEYKGKFLGVTCACEKFKDENLKLQKENEDLKELHNKNVDAIQDATDIIRGFQKELSQKDKEWKEKINSRKQWILDEYTLYGDKTIDTDKVLEWFNQLINIKEEK